MTPNAKMSTIACWLKVSRAAFLTASAMPVLVGTSLAWAASGQFDAVLLALAITGIVFIHAGANLANEYFDHILGADRLNPRPSRLFGGSGSIQEGLVSARNVLSAAIICLTAGAVLGLCIVFLTRSLFVLAVGVIGIVGAWCYTAPPLKLAYRTFGELTIALLFGVLPVWTSYYIQTGTLDLVPLIPALVAAILIFEVILANEFPDAPTDAAAGKRTIVVRFGARFAAAIYVSALACLYVLAMIAVALLRTLCPIYGIIGTIPFTVCLVYYLYTETLKGLSQFEFNLATIAFYHVVTLMVAVILTAYGCFMPVP